MNLPLLTSYKKVLKPYFNFLSQFCTPNSKNTPDKLQQEITHRRFLIIMIFELVVMILNIYNIIIGRGHVINNLTGIGICTSLILVIFISARYNPMIFNIYATIISALLGPTIMKYNEEGVHRACLAVLVHPLLNLLTTGNIWFYCLQSFFQIGYVTYLYPEPLTKTLINMTPEEITASFVRNIQSLAIVNLLGITCLNMILQSAYRKISNAEKRKEEVENQKTFLLGFSHELRNLINSLIGNVRLATLEPLPQKVHDLLKTADTCGELLLHLINNILDSGKLEVGDLEINPTPVVIHEALERIWKVCSELINRKCLNESLRIKHGLPATIKIDHYRLTQIFLNLVGNAVKFTDSGSIDITVEWLPNCIVNNKSFEPIPYNDNDFDEGLFEKSQRFCLIDKQQYAILTTINQGKIDISKLEGYRPIEYNNGKGVLKVIVQDTGLGIGPGSLGRLFQKFCQVSTDNNRRKLGTGLGLFITKQLCERMGGDIRAYSKERKGACFTFCISAEAISDAVIETYINQKKVADIRTNKITSWRSETQIIMAKKLKAMVVDDVPFNQSILKGFLTELGVEVVETAGNGLEAYKKYIDYATRGENLNIVTMDLNMPIMHGKVSGEKIREWETKMKLKPCLLMVVTGNCSESEMDECIDKNGKVKANAFLRKPLTIDDMARIVSEYIKINKL